MSASIWVPSGSGIVQSNLTRETQEFVATAGQTTFVLTGGNTYVAGSQNLEVYVQGLLIAPSLVTENADGITVIIPAVSLNDVVVLVTFPATATALEAYATSAAASATAAAASAAAAAAALAAISGFSGTVIGSGNLTFAGSSQRILGDFTNATEDSRLLFQTSTVDSDTYVGAIPAGTGDNSGFVAYSSSGTVTAANSIALVNKLNKAVVVVAGTDSLVVETQSVSVPVGTTAQRPTGAAGKIRYNSTTGLFEGYGSSWGSLGGGSGAITASGYTQATDRLLGRTTASTGAIEEISVGAGLSLSAGTLVSTALVLTPGTPVASTSGTAIDFTGIPAGCKRITITFDGVSTNGTDQFLIQVGDSGGIETSGYKSGTFWYAGGSGGGSTSTTGFIIGLTGGSVTNTFHGTITLTRYNSTYSWAAAGNLCFTDANAGATSSGGSKTLSDTLDRVRIGTTGGTNTFDAGTINVVYEV